MPDTEHADSTRPRPAFFGGSLPKAVARGARGPLGRHRRCTARTTGRHGASAILIESVVCLCLAGTTTACAAALLPLSCSQTSQGEQGAEGSAEPVKTMLFVACGAAGWPAVMQSVGRQRLFASDYIIFLDRCASALHALHIPHIIADVLCAPLCVQRRAAACQWVRVSLHTDKNAPPPARPLRLSGGRAT